MIFEQSVQWCFVAFCWKAITKYVQESDNFYLFEGLRRTRAQLGGSRPGGHRWWVARVATTPGYNHPLMAYSGPHYGYNGAMMMLGRRRLWCVILWSVPQCDMLYLSSNSYVLSWTDWGLNISIQGKIKITVVLVHTVEFISFELKP